MEAQRVPPATAQEKANREISDKPVLVPFVEGSVDFHHGKNTGALAVKMVDLNFAPVVKSQSYMNLMATPVWVTDRNNVPFCIPIAKGGDRHHTYNGSPAEVLSEIGGQGESFIVVQTFQYSADGVRQILDMYQRTKNPSRFLQYLYEKAKLPQAELYGIHFSRLIRLSGADLRRNSQGLFNYLADLWITLDPSHTSHPYANFDQKKAMDDVLDVYALGHKLGLVVDFVLNTPIPAQRYFSFLGSVYEVTSRPDPLRENGIHIYQSKDAVGAVQAVDILESFTSMEQLMESVHFFSTANDAKMMGNAEGLYKSLDSRMRMRKAEFEEYKTIKETEQLNLKMELETQKGKNAQLEEDNRQLASQRERDIASMKHTHALEIAALSITTKREEVILDQRKTAQEQERETIKDFYDNKSYQRKDVNEGTKFAYGIATAAFGFVCAVGTYLASRMGKTKALAGLSGTFASSGLGKTILAAKAARLAVTVAKTVGSLLTGLAPWSLLGLLF